MEVFTSGRNKHFEKKSVILMQKFYKYHGAGNDFVLIDNRTNTFVIDNDKIKQICNRRLCVGADGFILLNNSKEKGIDFEMQYFNSDGFEGSMCGNGGRCIVAFARRLGIIDKDTIFSGIDGLHKATILTLEGNRADVSIQMKDVGEIKSFDDGYFLDTGSPHVVKFIDDIHSVDMKECKIIRYDSRLQNGANVNFVEIQGENTIFVRTYERGVEDETLSCGTGVTASALAFAAQNNTLSEVIVFTRGGKFYVRFSHHEVGFSHVYLEGETCFVFEGTLIE
jgi:diaminopimelate epimerase